MFRIIWPGTTELQMTKDRLQKKHQWTFSPLPRLTSRPKFLSDQTFQTEIISDQTFQKNFPLIRLSRPKLPLVRCSRHKGSLNRLFRPKVFWSDHLQTMVQTPIQNIAQTLNRLWLDSSALEIVWSEKDLTYEKICLCYNFAVFNSSKDKSIIKVLLKKTKPNCWEQILFSVPFSVYFWLNGRV